MFVNTAEVGNQTKIANNKTNTGIKDTYMEFFMDNIFASYKKIYGKEAKQRALDESRAQLPTNVLSPV
jgi:hypothetical protein